MGNALGVDVARPWAACCSLAASLVWSSATIRRPVEGGVLRAGHSSDRLRPTVTRLSRNVNPRVMRACDPVRVFRPPPNPEGAFRTLPTRPAPHARGRFFSAPASRTRVLAECARRFVAAAGMGARVVRESRLFRVAYVSNLIPVQAQRRARLAHIGKSGKMGRAQEAPVRSGTPRNAR